MNLEVLKNRFSRLFAYLPVLWNTADFDYSNILEVERLQIKRVRDCLNECRQPENWKKHVAAMDLALRLLDIVDEDGEARIECDKMFVPAGKGLYTLNPDAEWNLDRYVNIRNSRRFMPKVDSSVFDAPKKGPMMRDALRVEKAWCIYHKLRQYKLRNWWN